MEVQVFATCSERLLDQIQKFSVPTAKVVVSKKEEEVSGRNSELKERSIQTSGMLALRKLGMKQIIQVFRASLYEHIFALKRYSI